MKKGTIDIIPIAIALVFLVLIFFLPIILAFQSLRTNREYARTHRKYNVGDVVCYKENGRKISVIYDNGTNVYVRLYYSDLKEKS